MKNPTIKDVAAQAGVSPSTVSYALSGKRPISQEVRTRIFAAIEELGFAPNASGRNLRSRRSRMIGIVFPMPPTQLVWQPLEFIAPAAAAINAANYGFSFFTGDLTPNQVLELLQSTQVDGLILMQIARFDPRVELLREYDYPFVMIGRCEDPSGLCFIDFDEEMAVYEAFRHLLELGHRRIGYIDLPQKERDEGIGFAMYIQRGFERACDDFSVQVLRRESDGSLEDGYRATVELLEADDRLTAFITLRGHTPIGALRALQAHGRPVPENSSLISITTAHSAEWSTPRLTSIDIPLEDMGRISAEMILRKLEDENTCEQTLVPARLILRDSTAPPPRL